MPLFLQFLRHRAAGRRLLAAALLMGGIQGSSLCAGVAIARADDQFTASDAAFLGPVGEFASRIDSDDAPSEFFMSDESEDPSSGGSVPSGASSDTGVPDNAGPPTPEPPPPSEFFMLDDGVWTPTPRYEADDPRGPASNAVPPPFFFNAATDWASVPETAAPRESSGFRACLNAACCAWEERWVNWRCGSEYLEGCIPEGFNGLPTIRATWPATLHSGPINQGGPVEPGGSAEGVTRSIGLDRKPVTQLSARITISTPGETPDASQPALADVPAERVHVPGTHRTWQGMSYYWDASHLIHQPLYFEDVNLERYGYSYGVAQPVVSAARFFGRIPLLPYALAAHPHYQAVYSLGDARPGSPTPYVHVYPPGDMRAALFEAAVVTGLFFAIP